MRRITLRLLSAGVLAAAACACTPEEGGSATGLAYPETMTVEHTDEYHGVQVADPYRWLEEDVRESERVRRWIDAQNELTFGFLGSIPERQAIEKRLTELWDYARYGLPEKRGGRYFYSYNDGLQDQPVVYVQSSLAAEPRLLLDPNTWSADGTVALGDFFPSPDGKYLAYLVQDAGSDWRKARVLEVDSGRVLEDELAWLKFTPLAWTHDGSGFYYSRYPEPESGQQFQSLNLNHAVWLHVLGTPQADDELAYHDPDHPDWNYTPTVTDDGRYLVITVWKGTDSRYQILYQDLADEHSRPAMLIEGFDHDYSLIGNVGSELYFRTDKAAPLGRLIAIDVAAGAPGSEREVLPESADVLQSARLVGGRVVALYMQDAHSAVRTFATQGEPLGEIELPALGTASGFGGRFDDPETFFRFESFNVPDRITRLDLETGEMATFREAHVDISPDDYVVQQVFYESKDGTRVPMFITHRRGLALDGQQPTLLYGYGGFDISLTPSFSVTRLAWMEMGGVYAVANIRGGGEYGEQWHKAGTRLHKQNVFDDFIAAAEYLIDAGYTNPDRLAIMGGSNGGLLMGAVTNQRPELFGAVIAAAGVMDMLRFEDFTAGRYWVDDYGSKSDPEEFRALLAYSPYQNVRPGTKYPAVLVTTADHDDRVVPAHSFKYAAALQAAQAGPDPVLIRIETRAGHGAGTPTGKLIESYADQWAFLVRALGMELPESYATRAAAP
jgi:prolyl oligopeptidase